LENLSFKIGKIDGAAVMPVAKNIDERGWLAELYRTDELDESIFPKMAYVSLTNPGVKRGPHEHKTQTDYFCFIGPSNFKIILWDNRKSSKTYMNKTVLFFGEDKPASVIVPPGVVHAYKNIGLTAGIVINAANVLYAGYKKQEPVDEIRYENDSETIFKFD
jgi:dTDP-4-dehydrorhamnose 3,5-epimerase